uniref:Aminopeptidase P N-terminal domain-containing protein n=1 Tax=Strigamia maritima TaxID=126957 RepID=T1IM68_STRMM
MAPKNTGNLLKNLRLLMKNTNYVTETLQAYIIPSNDNHQSEYVAACDKRRAFISGFTGSMGTAVVTEQEAALWTDGRYFLQAVDELDNNWLLMKEGIAHPISQAAWLNKVLPLGSRVGVDPFLMAADIWTPLSNQLEAQGHSLVPVHTNLIDLVWDDRPSPPSNPIVIHPVSYTGKPWQDKVRNVQAKMIEKGATICIMTALDNIAWLLNLRGSDIDYNPVFFSYIVLTQHSVHFLVDETKLSNTVLNHLKPENLSAITVHIHPYTSFKDFINTIIAETSGKVWVNKNSSYGIHDLIPENRRLIEPSPVAPMKAIKNAVEIAGMQKAHIKDAVALCEYYAWLEAEVPKGNVTEILGAQQLLRYRKEQHDFIGLSFKTISSVGPSGSIIHYQPSEETDRPITTHELYLCDSGGQYRDGTTDVTRTVHFGTPSQYERECFTCVLKGHIALSTTIFPNFLKGQMLDTLARTALWEQGLDYQHGTGHGVGSYLNVHEGPMGIGNRVLVDDPGLQEGMIVTIEPGYYEENKFGIRIENVVLIKKAETKQTFRNQTFLMFQPITLVPIQIKMFEPSMLTSKEIEWLDTYHQQCREVIGKELEKQGRARALEWLLKETQPLG